MNMRTLMIWLGTALLASLAHAAPVTLDGTEQ